jgi:hypothetical protein
MHFMRLRRSDGPRHARKGGTLPKKGRTLMHSKIYETGAGLHRAIANSTRSYSPIHTFFSQR